MRARFTGFVRVPSTIVVRAYGASGGAFAFDAVDAADAAVLADGLVVA